MTDIAADTEFDDLAGELEPAAAVPLEADKRLAEAKRGIVLADDPVAKLQALLAGAKSLALPVSHGFIPRADVMDELLEQARNCGLGEDPGEYVVVATISRGLIEGLEATTNGHSFDLEPPPPNGPHDYGFNSAEPSTQPALPRVRPPLTIDEWSARDLPPPDRLMGHLLSTTSRGLVAADTGLGKTLYAMHLSMAMAGGLDFLHWKGRRACKVLYIDGEMSRRLYRERINAGAARLGGTPAGWYGLNHEDVEGFAPLNTPAGQAYIEWLIAELGGVDFIFFDSFMCLLAGNLKETELWAQTLPWVLSLTKRKIGQLWINHTGHDKSVSYGDKSKEWQMDCVMHLTAVEHAQTDVSFNLEFRKARERDPSNRADFQNVHITLVDDKWAGDAKATGPGKIDDVTAKFLTALHNALAEDGAPKIGGRRAATSAAWKSECERMGLIDLEAKPDAARSKFSRHRLRLIGANYVGCDGDLTWTL